MIKMQTIIVYRLLVTLLEFGSIHGSLKAETWQAETSVIASDHLQISMGGVTHILLYPRALLLPASIPSQSMRGSPRPVPSVEDEPTAPRAADIH